MIPCHQGHTSLEVADPDTGIGIRVVQQEHMMSNVRKGGRQAIGLGDCMQLTKEIMSLLF
jgi:hypothetical protein